MKNRYRLLSPATDPTDAGAPAGVAVEDASLLDGFDAAIAGDQELAPEVIEATEAPEATGDEAPVVSADAPAKDAAPEATADPIEDEIASLSLKDKAASRFRELTAEVKELAPLREQLKAAGIEKVEDLPRIAQRAKDADELIGMVQETGASPEQYGAALDYLRLINAGTRGDIKAAEQAYEIMSKEVAALGQLLGREIPGIHDPLAQHADLLAAIDNGDITRQHALEIVQARTQRTVRSRADEQTQAQTKQQQVVDTARNGLIAFDQQAAGSDPQYAAKRPILNGIVATIRETLPPEQWLAATQRAYAAIQLPAAPVAPPAPRLPSPGPVRASGPRPAMTPTFTSPEEALDYGIGLKSA